MKETHPLCMLLRYCSVLILLRHISLRYSTEDVWPGAMIGGGGAEDVVEDMLGTWDTSECMDCASLQSFPPVVGV